MGERSKLEKKRKIDRAEKRCWALLQKTKNMRMPHEDEVILDSYLELYHNLEEMLDRIYKRDVS